MIQQKRIRLPVKELQIWSLGWEDPLEKEMAAHSSIVAWEIPWTKEPGKLRSVGSQRARYSLATKLEQQKNYKDSWALWCSPETNRILWTNYINKNNKSKGKTWKKLNNIPSYMHSMFCLSIYLLTDTWVVSSFGFCE